MQHTHTCAHTRANTGSQSPALGAAVVSRCCWSLGASSSRYQSYSPLRSLNPLNWERLWFTERERAKQSKVRENRFLCESKGTTSERKVRTKEWKQVKGAKIKTCAGQRSSGRGWPLVQRLTSWKLNLFPPRRSLRPLLWPRAKHSQAQNRLFYVVYDSCKKERKKKKTSGKRCSELRENRNQRVWEEEW